MTDINYDFSNRVAVITGGANGIGAAIADQLRRCGAQIAIWDMQQGSVSDDEYFNVDVTNNQQILLANFEDYLNGFSDNVKEIVECFNLRAQIRHMAGKDVLLDVVEKFVSPYINLTPEVKEDPEGNKLPALSNLGMGYVFEELIRKFNEENNEEAGEHFTPREIIRLMTHIVFEPLKGKIKEHARYSIYDPACGSGGMLTEAEHFAEEITSNKSKFVLYGQEVNPETYAICTSDMLIKNENPENIAYGSTLGNDGFMGKEFDFMLSNPPYGKSWKIDIDAIQDGKKIVDPRFSVGTPRSSDGQSLFLANMAYKMKNNTDLGSRVASVHNGSALFTGDAGSGESNIRKWLIENDWVDCIIGLPKNMFYNTGISTYIFILSNRKLEHRKGKVQLIDASEIYKKKRKSLGNKSNELTKDHIRQITDIYLNFEATEKSKIFENSDFGYQKIIIDRPLRLSCQFTQEKVDGLRFHNSLQDEMEYIYKQFGEDVYSDIKQHKETLLKYWEANEIKVSPANKNKLFDVKYWKVQKGIMDAAQKLFNHFGNTVSNDFNIYKGELDKSIKKLKISISPSEKKQIINAISWKNEEAEPIVKKKEKDGSYSFTHLKKFYELWKGISGKRTEVASNNPDIQIHSFLKKGKSFVAINNLTDEKQEVKVSFLNKSDNYIKNITLRRLYTTSTGLPRLVFFTNLKSLTSLSLKPGETVIAECDITDLEFKGAIKEKNFYTDTYLQTIKKDKPLTFNFTELPKVSNGSASLKMGIGRNHNLSKKPTITVNGNPIEVPNNWAGYDQASRKLFFGVIGIPFDIKYLKSGENIVKITFPDDGGHLSSLILNVENKEN